MHFGANRGIAYEAGRVFTAGMDGRVDALDAKTGRVLWTAESIPPEAMFSNSTGAPRTMNGKVIIGNGGADIGARGFVTAFDAATGRQLWRFYTTPGRPDQNKGDPAMEAAAKTWRGEWWKAGTGGTVWNGMTFDAERNRIYLGVGNAGPYDPEKRSPGGGDNLYTSGIVALDANRQVCVALSGEPARCVGLQGSAEHGAGAAEHGGGERTVLMHAPTNGFFYVLDRDTGKLVNQPGKTTYINWASSIDMVSGRPVENPDIRYEKGATEIWPGTIGGHNWQAMSYSPRTGWSISGPSDRRAVLARCARAERHCVQHLRAGGRTDHAQVARRWQGHAGCLGPGGTAGSLESYAPAPVEWRCAIDCREHRVPGHRRWLVQGFRRAQRPRAVEVQRRAGHHRRADELARGRAAVRLGAGRLGRDFGGDVERARRWLEIRRAGATAADIRAWRAGQAAQGAPRDMKVHALDDPSLVLNEADVTAGRGLHIACAACHGAGFRSAGAPGPDLRESAIALDLASFTLLVKEGKLEKGMPKFGWMTDTQIRQVWAYTRARAREALGRRAPYKPGVAAAGALPEEAKATVRY